MCLRTSAITARPRWPAGDSEGTGAAGIPAAQHAPRSVRSTSRPRRAHRRRVDARPGRMCLQEAWRARLHDASTRSRGRTADPAHPHRADSSKASTPGALPLAIPARRPRPFPGVVGLRAPCRPQTSSCPGGRRRQGPSPWRAARSPWLGRPSPPRWLPGPWSMCRLGCCARRRRLLWLPPSWSRRTTS